MNILVIGGTVFLGKHFVEAALKKGHNITMFNRGIHNPELFPGVEKIKGDRKTDMNLLKSRKWDAALDTCGYAPSVVKASSEALKDSVKQYVFISSVSVYDDFSKEGLDENSSVGKLAEDTEEVTGETYGPLKALCENEVTRIYGNNALNIRPGLIVGPDDPSDRFTYWPERISEGGAVLAPDARSLPVQFIDVRDLAEWILLTMENKESGTFNATGPGKTILFGSLLEQINTITGNKSSFDWVSEDFLNDHNISPWMDMPLWLPESMGGMGTVNIQKALNAGLKFRTLDQITKDTLDWVKTLPAGREKRAGISRDKEKELLDKWRKTIK